MGAGFCGCNHQGRSSPAAATRVTTRERSRTFMALAGHGTEPAPRIRARTHGSGRRRGNGGGGGGERDDCARIPQHSRHSRRRPSRYLPHHNSQDDSGGVKDIGQQIKRTSYSFSRCLFLSLPLIVHQTALITLQDHNRFNLLK